MLNNSQNQIFQYNGSPITFKKGNSVMVNATEMAKAFNKRVPEWTRLQSSKEFLDNLWSLRNGCDPVVQKMHYHIEQVDDNGLNHILKSFDRDLHLIVTSIGGKLQGTWMHEDVALEFARWLSPAFAIWCNDRIKELLLNGSTKLSNDSGNTETLHEALSKIESLTSQLEESRAELHYMRGRMEAEREIAVLQYRLSIVENRQPEHGDAHSYIPISHYGPVMLSGKEIKEEHPGVMLVREVCERMEEENNICIKTSNLFEWLRGNGYLLSGNDCFNRPSEECMRNNWMMYTCRRGTTPEGVKYCTPYITPKGYDYFSELILKEGGAQ